MMEVGYISREREYNKQTIKNFKKKRMMGKNKEKLEKKKVIHFYYLKLETLNHNAQNKFIPTHSTVIAVTQRWQLCNH